LLPAISLTPLAKQYIEQEEQQPRHNKLTEPLFDTVGSRSGCSNCTAIILAKQETEPVSSTTGGCIETEVSSRITSLNGLIAQPELN
jgi:hypothetical protein